MKNYHNLKRQREMCLMYLESLFEQRALLNSVLNPKTVRYDTIAVKGGEKPDIFAAYTQNSARIENQILAVKEELEGIQNKLNKMEEMLRDVKNNKYQIFVYRYLDNLSANEIAKKTNFSVRRVYQILNEIERLLTT